MTSVENVKTGRRQMCVFLVDDESTALEWMLGAFDNNEAWAPRTFKDGASALEAMATEPCDVIISDTRMAAMDGMVLLGHVRESHPEVARILVAGEHEGNGMRGLAVAHQMLSKGSAHTAIRSAAQRSCELQQRLMSPQLREMFGRIDALPSPTATVMELNRTLSKPDASIDQVGRIVARDPAMTAKLLQMVNSAFFGLSHQITDVKEAVVLLGLGTVRNLAAALDVFRSFERSSPTIAAAIEDLHGHSLAVAHLARELVSTQSESFDAFVAALLHDVGLLALAANMPNEYLQLQMRTMTDRSPITVVEHEVVGTSHADLGAHLLSLWGLPYGVVEAVARHHDAPQIEHRTMDATHAVYVAQALTLEDPKATQVTFEISAEPLDDTYLEELGISERVAGWTALRSDLY